MVRDPEESPRSGRHLRLAARPRDERLRLLVEQHLDFVARNLRNLGVPASELDDSVQRTFLVLSRRLDEVREGSERAFLFRVAMHDAAHVRRSLSRRREVDAELASELADDFVRPDRLSDQKAAREVLDRLLDELDLELRSVFVLYELEEMTMVQIAEALEIPVGTVASRLRRAREDFQARVRRLALKEKREAGR